MVEKMHLGSDPLSPSGSLPLTSEPLPLTSAPLPLADTLPLTSGPRPLTDTPLTSGPLPLTDTPLTRPLPLADTPLTSEPLPLTSGPLPLADTPLTSEPLPLTSGPLPLADTLPLTSGPLPLADTLPLTSETLLLTSGPLPLADTLSLTPEDPLPHIVAEPDTHDQVEIAVKPRRSNVAWTDAETKAVVKGYGRHSDKSNKWARIRDDPELSLSHRTNGAIKDKWRNIMKADAAAAKSRSLFSPPAPSGSSPLPLLCCSVSLGPVPSGSVPSGSVPSGSVPSGSAPSGSAPPGSAPPGSAPPGSFPPAPVPPGSVPPAPVRPAPVRPAPVRPAPVFPAPVFPAPVRPAPVCHAPVWPELSDLSTALGASLPTAFEAVVPSLAKEIAKCLAPMLTESLRRLVVPVSSLRPLPRPGILKSLLLSAIDDLLGKDVSYGAISAYLSETYEVNRTVVEEALQKLEEESKIRCVYIGDDHFYSLIALEH